MKINFLPLICQQLLKKYFLTEEGRTYADLESRSFTEILSGFHKVMSVFGGIKSFTGSVKDMKVLDVGCNIGYYSFLLAEEGAEVLGMDINGDFIRKAVCMAKLRELPFKGVIMDVEAYLDSSTDNFELTLFLNLFHHLILKNEERAWRIMNKISERSEKMVFIMDLGASWLPGGGQGAKDILYMKAGMSTVDDLAPLIITKSKFTDCKKLVACVKKNRDLWGFWR